MVRLPNWLPDALTPAQGTELEKLSFLGPFLSMSCFAEDSVSLTQIPFLFSVKITQLAVD